VSSLAFLCVGRSWTNPASPHCRDVIALWEEPVGCDVTLMRDSCIQVCLSVIHLLVCQSVWLSVGRSAGVSVYLSVCLSLGLSVGPVGLDIHFSICLFPSKKPSDSPSWLRDFWVWKSISGNELLPPPDAWTNNWWNRLFLTTQFHQLFVSWDRIPPERDKQPRKLPHNSAWGW